MRLLPLWYAVILTWPGVAACSSSPESPPRACFAFVHDAPRCADAPLESCATSPMCSSSICRGFVQTDGGVYEGTCL